MKYKYQTSFYDPVYQAAYKVVYLTTPEHKEYLEKYEMKPFSGMFDYDTNTFLIYDYTLNTIAHECFHALESNLFRKRGVTLDLSQFNEHLAYYIGFLVEKVDKSLKKLKAKYKDESS